MGNTTGIDWRYMPLKDRLFARVEVTDGCWYWKGPTSGGGYGKISVNREGRVVHRVCYELLVGPIPENLVLDHICRVKHCVNPSHLRAVDSRTNSVENSVSPMAVNAAKTHCVNGHELSGDNVKHESGVYKGWAYTRRHCLACRRLADRKRRARKRTALSPFTDSAEVRSDA